MYLFFFLFREFRNAFVIILNYNNCKCLPFSSGKKVRTSISKSNYSMNTKLTPPIQSRQTSVTPHSNPSQRNGCVSYETSSSLCTPLPKNLNFLTKTDSTDTFEMQIFNQQRQTLEAFHELEHLVPNGISGRASIVEMSSIIQDQDNTFLETPKPKKLKLKSNSNHS